MKLRTKFLFFVVSLVFIFVLLLAYVISETHRINDKSIHYYTKAITDEFSAFFRKQIIDEIYKIEEVQTRHFFIEFISKSNESFTKKENLKEYIDSVEKRWTGNQHVFPQNYDQILNNRLSSLLKDKYIKNPISKNGYSLFKEVFVTNKYGAVIAMTNKSTDYDQSNEHWWQQAKQNGIYISDIEYDHSSDCIGISVANAFYDKEHNFIGVIKGVLSLYSIIETVKYYLPNLTESRVIITTFNGHLLYDTRTYRFMENVSDEPFYKASENNEELIHLQDSYFTFSDFSMGPGFDFKGARVFLSFRSEFLHRNLYRLLRKVAALTLIIICIILIFIFFFFIRFSRPIKVLTKYTEKIVDDINTPIPHYNKNDEIGMLYNAFGIMKNKIIAHIKEIRESEEKFRSYIENSPIGILMLDKTGKFYMSNRAIQKLLDYSEEELNTFKVGDLQPKEHSKAGRKFFEKLISKKENKGIMPFVTKNNKLIYTQLNARVMPNNEIIGFITDITENKRNEENLLIFKNFAENANVGFGIADMNKMLRYCNKHVLQMIGLDKLTPGTVSLFSVYDEKYKEFYKKTVLPSLLKDGYWQGETQMINVKTKQPINVSENLFLIKDKKGNNIFIANIVNDITEEKRFKQDLLNYSKKLETSNEELQQFAYAASHDLQAPLRKIISFTKLFEMDYGELLKDGEGSQYLERIVKSSKKMMNFIDKLLEYSRVNREEMKLTKVNLNKTLNSVQENLYEEIEKYKAEISIKELPAVDGIPILIEQLFQNLISNGIKYQIKGNIPKISVYPMLSKIEEEHIIVVEDNGIGIKAESLNKVFLPFYRLNSEEEYPGSGIGLSTCKKIIEKHKAKISIESKPGKGSKFIIHFYS